MFIDTLFSKISTFLFGIFMLFVLVTWLIRTIKFTKNKINNSLIKIQSKLVLESNKSIYIIDVKNVRLVLGVTANKIVHLYTLSSNFQKKNKNVLNVLSETNSNNNEHIKNFWNKNNDL